MRDGIRYRRRTWIEEAYFRLVVMPVEAVMNTQAWRRVIEPAIEVFIDMFETPQQLPMRHPYRRY